MEKYFFALDRHGKWHYQYKIWYEHQEEFCRKHYLEMKDQKFAYEDAPFKWVQCLFCTLEEEFAELKDKDYWSEKQVVELKLQKLNDTAKN